MTNVNSLKKNDVLLHLHFMRKHFLEKLRESRDPIYLGAEAAYAAMINSIKQGEFDLEDGEEKNDKRS